MRFRFVFLFFVVLLLGGCGGRKSRYRSGIFNYNNRTIAWYTNKHRIGYAFSLPEAVDISDSLVTTKKNLALLQRITTADKTYKISCVNELKDGASRVYINDRLFENLDETYILEKNGVLIREKSIPEDLKKKIIAESRATPSPHAADPLFWLVLGFVAQILFSSRMIVQWYSSEKAGRSVVPVAFWFLSIGGSFLLLSYAIYREDPVFILGQASGSLIYFRNLILIWKEHKQKKLDIPELD